MPKISGTTPDVIAWSDRSCTVTLRLVTCKREKHLKVMGTLVGYLSRAFRCLNAFRELGRSGDPIELNSECSQRVDMLQVHRHCVSNRRMLRVHGTIAGYASDVRRRIECCDMTPPSARAGQCRMDSGEPTRWHSGVMRDDLFGSRAPTPATICPGYMADIDDVVKSGRVTKFPGKNLA
ncbi:hypothetical protein TIFTF001_005516 [Ficus carica]|uniref:Uncharacterized protein n=1 Tax=Ficus carica TaxID=3494 RepID=A0AA88A1U0_FICCA|nr:hypothetical protein TIFTF001_005516 [Ficus carica]